LFLPGDIPERAFISVDTKVLGVPGGPEEDISDSVRYQRISLEEERRQGRLSNESR
jgi:hypothetical protein